MLKALICLFAIYGLGCFIYFNVKELLHPDLDQANTTEPEEVVLCVKDVEDKIEGLVREFVRKEQYAPQPRRLTVIDTGSQDQTKDILERLAYRYPYLSVQYSTAQHEVPSSQV